MKRKDRIEQAIIHLVSVAQNLNDATQDVLCRLEVAQDRIAALEDTVEMLEEAVSDAERALKKPLMAPGVPQHAVFPVTLTERKQRNAERKAENRDLREKDTPDKRLKIEDLVVWR